MVVEATFETYSVCLRVGNRDGSGQVGSGQKNGPVDKFERAYAKRCKAGVCKVGVRKHILKTS